jgi:hypothetical protein
MIFQILPSNPPKKNQNYSPLEIHSPIQVNNQKLNICCFYSKYHFFKYFLKMMTFYFLFSGIGGVRWYKDLPGREESQD